MVIDEQEFASYQAVLVEIAKSGVIDAGDYEAAAQLVLRAACKGLQVERASLWHFDDTAENIVCRALLVSDQGFSPGGKTLSAERFPRYINALLEERSVVAHDALNTPETRELAEDYLKSLGITSMIDSPIFSHGQLTGILCCEHTGPQRHWQLFEQIFAASLADIMSRALTASDRKAAETAVRDSEERFRGAFDQSVSPMVLLTATGQVLKVNQAACEFTGLAATTITQTGCTSFIHPDDVAIAEGFLVEMYGGQRRAASFSVRTLHASGRVLWVIVHATLVFDANDAPRYVTLVIQDITRNHFLAEQLSHQATHDALTNLVNRAEFERRLEMTLESVRDHGGEHALCYFDLDQFKVVNDTCGHAAGDELLRQLSAALLKGARETDIIARLGGDEFGILMENCPIDQAEHVAKRVLNTIRNFHFGWEGRSFQVGASLGLVAFTPDTASVSELLQHADIACFAAKDAGRNRIHCYQANDVELAQRQAEMHWVGRIHKAMAENRFQLYAQAIIPLALDSTRKPHAELLLRMVDERGDIVLPNAFLPAAERYNIVAKIDRWVIAKAFATYADNTTALNQCQFFSINLSGQSLADAGLLDFILDHLATYAIEPGKVCFEITETSAIANLTAATHFIATLREVGCHFALDDFGTGLSSFAYLRQLDADYLKIDSLFVRDILKDPVDRGIVKTINELSQLIGKKTIAEFAENKEILAILRELKVDFAQGHGIGEPMPVADFFLPRMA